MNFTEDWVSHNEKNFMMCMGHLGFTRGHFLEIGSFEGRSTCWFLQNGLADDGTMTCIDTFTPYWYKEGDLLERFQVNVREAKKKYQVVSTLAMNSPQGLAQLIQQKQEYDFIYIDGDHSPAGVLTDAVMAWGLLRKGGVMLFDDYEYDREPTKIGIDAFLAGFEGQYEIVLQNYQIAVMKR
jgi:predicted O-methyltransferase YrrM